MGTAPFIAPVRSPYPAYKVQVCCMRNDYLYTSLSSDALNNSFSGNRVKNARFCWTRKGKIGDGRHLL